MDTKTVVAVIAVPFWAKGPETVVRALRILLSMEVPGVVLSGVVVVCDKKVHSKGNPKDIAALPAIAVAAIPSSSHP